MCKREKKALFRCQHIQSACLSETNNIAQKHCNRDHSSIIHSTPATATHIGLYEPPCEVYQQHVIYLSKIHTRIYTALCDSTQPHSPCQGTQGCAHRSFQNRATLRAKLPSEARSSVTLPLVGCLGAGPVSR